MKTATLVNGETYTYGGVVFRKGQPRTVTDEVAKYLEENAWDETVTIRPNKRRQVNQEQKFEFEDLDPPKRRRGRPRSKPKADE